MLNLCLFLNSFRYYFILSIKIKKMLILKRYNLDYFEYFIEQIK